MIDADVVRDGFDESFVGGIHLLRGGSGTPLLYLHGGGAVGLWRRFHALLAQHFDVLAPDLPGYGRSEELPPGAGMPELVTSQLELLDRLGIERAVLVGSSFGGWVAAELALRAPARISRLTLLAGSGLDLPDAPLTPLFPRPREEARDMLFGDQSVAQRFSSDSYPGCVLGTDRDHAALARYIGSPSSLDDAALARIANPTLLVWGGDDRIVPLAHGHHYAARLPDARLEVLAGVGHGLVFESPAQVVELIAAG